MNFDGTVVVGINFEEHLIWKKGQGFESIGGRVPNPYMGRVSVSDNGELIGGTLKLGFSSEMAIYDISNNQWDTVSSEAADTTIQEKAAIGYRISGDGTKFVGVKLHDYSWFDPLTNTGTLSYPSGNWGARANVTNIDGSVVGGCVIASGGLRMGAYWKNDICHLLLDASNNFVGEVMAVSGDGTTLFGYDYGNNHDLYKYDIASNTFEVLCSASVNSKSPILIDISDDGKVGFAVYYDFNNMEKTETYIYIDKPEGEDDIYMNVNEFLDDEGIDRKGVNVVNVTAVSGNGHIFTGIDGKAANLDSSFLVDMSKFFSPFGISDHSQNIELQISPNPVTEVINITSKSMIDEILIYNIYGRLVKRKQINGQEGSVEVSKLLTGVYIIKSAQGNNTFTKFIKL